MKILILCTGNSCRSQMAHGFLQSFNEDITVCSAGTEATSVPDGPIRGRERRFFLVKGPINRKMFSFFGRAPALFGPPVGRERTRKSGAFFPGGRFCPAPGPTATAQPREATPCRNRPCSKNGRN